MPSAGARNSGRRCGRYCPRGTPGPVSAMVTSAHARRAARAAPRSAALGREGDRIVDDVLQHGLDHLLVGVDDDARAAMWPSRPSCRSAIASAWACSRPMSSIERSTAVARRVDEIGGRLVEPAGGGDETVEAIERALDQADGALAARDCRRRSRGCSGSSDCRMTAIGVLKACALSSAARRMSRAEASSAATMRSNSAATTASSGTRSRRRRRRRGGARGSRGRARRSGAGRGARPRRC